MTIHGNWHETWRVHEAPYCAVLCRSVISDFLRPHDRSLPASSVHGGSPGKNTGVGYHALLQGIFPTQGSNPGLPHCRWILYHLSYWGSPRILEWVAYPLGDLLDPGIKAGSPALQGDSLPAEPPRKLLMRLHKPLNTCPSQDYTSPDLDMLPDQTLFLRNLASWIFFKIT